MSAHGDDALKWLEIDREKLKADRKNNEIKLLELLKKFDSNLDEKVIVSCLKNPETLEKAAYIFLSLTEAGESDEKVANAFDTLTHELKLSPLNSKNIEGKTYWRIEEPTAFFEKLQNAIDYQPIGDLTATIKKFGGQQASVTHTLQAGSYKLIIQIPNKYLLEEYLNYQLQYFDYIKDRILNPIGTYGLMKSLLSLEITVQCQDIQQFISDCGKLSYVPACKPINLYNYQNKDFLNGLDPNKVELLIKRKLLLDLSQILIEQYFNRNATGKDRFFSFSPTTLSKLNNLFAIKDVNNPFDIDVMSDVEIETLYAEVTEIAKNMSMNREKTDYETRISNWLKDNITPDPSISSPNQNNQS